MDDREMLELAAKAAGITGKMHKTLGGWDCIFISGTNHPWQPLYDDADALRLAVKLGLFDLDKALVELAIAEPESKSLDSYAATRRAIVRAATAIGKEGK